jgi:RTX calcium-binding nonapeptide repeat (4 copies)
MAEHVELQERWSLRLERRPVAVVVVAVLASLMLTWAGTAQAKRIVGTTGPDRIAGTAKADVIKARGGDDRAKGRRGRDRVSGGRGADRLWGGGGTDRLSGGRGADRLNAVDGRQDRAVRGGPGKDVCRIDEADRASVKGCETVTIGTAGGPGGGPGGSPGGGVCASPPEEAGDGAPTFSDPFYALTLSLKASADGLNGDELPISIEEVCDVPKELESEAAQLVGGDGVALITADTKVFDAAGQELTGEAATTALAGADTVSLKAQLERPGQWRQDEDGEPVPTFATSRADITD